MQTWETSLVDLQHAFTKPIQFTGTRTKGMLILL